MKTITGKNAGAKKMFRVRELFFAPGIVGPMQTLKVAGYMTEPYGAGRNRGKSPISDDPNSQIASKLRALYLSVQEEAVPDRFLDLLEKLDAAERRTASAQLNRS